MLADDLLEFFKYSSNIIPIGILVENAIGFYFVP